MGNLSSILLGVQVLSSLTIIGLVLLQQGKGADMGSAFGGGSAGSMFGAAGAANFLSRMTKWAAVVFFVSTGGLAWVAHHPAKQQAEGLMQGYESPIPGTAAPAVSGSVPSAPAAPSSVPTAPAASNQAQQSPADPSAQSTQAQQ